jgi:hypothetical protein
MYIDADVRNNVSTFNIDNGNALIEQIMSDVRNSDELKINSLKERYFGKKYDRENIRELSYKLAKELHI